MGSYLFGSQEIKDITPFLPEEFESSKGNIPKEELLKNEIIAVYFSAHWCGPCRGFTPKLAKFYNEVNSEKKQVEIIFDSLDSDLKSFKEYFSSMPWIATPYESDEREKIQEACGINSIPQLIVFDNKGNVLDDSGRSTVESQGVEAINTWRNKIPKEV